MASPEAIQQLQQCSHRHPLDGDQIRTLCNALTTLRRVLGEENAYRTSLYATILRLLKAHVTPFPTSSPITFSQVQAARLQLLADKLIKDHKVFPPELSAAITQGLVSGFDPASNAQLPFEHQRHQLSQQQLAERNRIVEERKLLSERHADFSNTRNACLSLYRRERQQIGPDPDVFIPWEQRQLKVNPPLSSNNGRNLLPTLTNDVLESERQRFLRHRTQTVVKDVTQMLDQHRSGANPLSPRGAALLETRLRHAKLLALQEKMRQTVWDEHQTDRDTRRSTKSRARTLKQLQREFEKVDRARIRQIEAEERDARRKRQAWLNAMVEHLNKFRSYHRDVVRRGMRAVTKAVLKHHDDVARNTSRAEREAEKARIQKLKDDDEEGYLELVRKTKNRRLLELLDQTDKYLKELGAVVKEERAKSGVVEYENGREKAGARVSYYEIAHAIKEEVLEQSNLLVGGTLKEYQLQGIQWMVSLYNNRLNGILADEMGLGKTIQTLGLIAHLMEKKDNPGPYLIIVPLSTISNWEMEFARWAPAIRVIVFKGDNKARRKLYDQVIEKKSFNVCLVTYEYVVRGKNLLKRIEWQHIVIDEGHRIKNHESRLSSVLHAHYRSRNRLLLTGTPLQNSLTELWALLNFLLPNVFKSAESFESWFAAPFAQMGVGNVSNTDDQAQLTEEESLLIIRRLHQVLRPFLLRRLKSDVLRMGEQLPEKQEHVILVEMSAWQRHVYVKIVKSDYLLFTDNHGRRRYDKLPNPAVQLRKCVNHPYLFYADHASKLVDTPQLWRASGKFDMLDSMVTKLLRTGHRILIFNQMTKVVDLQERLLRYRNIPFYRLDGTTSTEERKDMVNDFNNEDTDVHVFLLTTRAGGLGVNLQTADTVIIFDSDWNPSMDQQAQDRAHRIGQRREVLVVRLLTNKSIEESVMERASFKRGLEKKIIRAGMFDEQSKDSERQAMLRELLRVESPGSDDDRSDDGLPTEEEVNRILARSEEEFTIFTRIDQERADEIAPRQRLMVDKEIPEWAVKVPKSLLQKAKTSGAGSWAGDLDGIDRSLLNEPKRKRAATANVSYGIDQLSERQYIKLVERSEAGEVLSYDAVRAYTSRRKRRRKGEATKTELDCSESGKNFDPGYDGDGRVSSGAPASEGMAASKSIDTDARSMDDDATEGGEQSAVHSAADDIIIEEEDGGDDDEDETDNGKVVPHDDTRLTRKDRIGSEVEDASPPSDEGVSEFSEESGSQSDSPSSTPVRGRKRVAVRMRRRTGFAKRRRKLPETPDASETVEKDQEKSGTPSSSQTKRANRGDSSDESPAPIRRPTSRKRPKVLVTNLRSSPVENISQTISQNDEFSKPQCALKKLSSSSGDKVARVLDLERQSASLNPQPLVPSDKESLHTNVVRENQISPACTMPLSPSVKRDGGRPNCVIDKTNNRDIGKAGGNGVNLKMTSSKTILNGSSPKKIPTSRRPCVTETIPLSVPLPKLSPLGSSARKNACSPALPSLKSRAGDEPGGKVKIGSFPKAGTLLDKQSLPVLSRRASSPLSKRPFSPPKLPATFKELSSGPLPGLANPPILPTSPRIPRSSSHFKRAETRLNLDDGSLAGLPSKKPSSKPSPQARILPQKALQKSGLSQPPSKRSSNCTSTSFSTKGTARIHSMTTIKDSKVADSDAEDGEIREDGELSENGECSKQSNIRSSDPSLPAHSSSVSQTEKRAVGNSGLPETRPNRSIGRSKVPMPMRPLPPMVSRLPSGHSSRNGGPRLPISAPPMSRNIAVPGSRPPPLPYSSPAGTVGRPGNAVINRQPLPPVGRSGVLPKRASMASGTILNPMRPGGPPTSAPIIAMPHLPPPGGMGTPNTLHGPGVMGPIGMGCNNMMNHRGIGHSSMVPGAHNMPPSYGPYGMRGGPGYGGMGMYGPPGTMGGAIKRGMHGNVRPTFNGRSPGGGPPSSMSNPPHLNRFPKVNPNTPQDAKRVGAATKRDNENKSELIKNGFRDKNKPANSPTDGEKVEGKETRRYNVAKVQTVPMKDMEDGEEGEIEEEGEIVES